MRMVDLLDAFQNAVMDKAEPQAIVAILEAMCLKVTRRDNGDGWFDLIGMIEEGEDAAPVIGVRYQWWDGGWHYMLVHPRNY